MDQIKPSTYSKPLKSIIRIVLIITNQIKLQTKITQIFQIPI